MKTKTAGEALRYAKAYRIIIKNGEQHLYLFNSDGLIWCGKAPATAFVLKYLFKKRNIKPL